jgi:hypothetical protein
MKKEGKQYVNHNFKFRNAFTSDKDNFFRNLNVISLKRLKRQNAWAMLLELIIPTFC